MNQPKQVKTVKELNEFFAGKEIMIIGDHENAGTITKFVCMVNADGTQPNLADGITKQLRMCVNTAFHRRLYLQPKNIYVLQKQQSIWN